MKNRLLGEGTSQPSFLSAQLASSSLSPHFAFELQPSSRGFDRLTEPGVSNQGNAAPELWGY